MAIPLGKVKTRLTDERIEAALQVTLGEVYLAAERLGCLPEELHRRISGSANLTALVAAQRGKMVDTAEATLYRALLEGAPWAVKMMLTTQGEERGYAAGRRRGVVPAAPQRERGASVQETLQQLLGHADYLEFCRTRVRTEQAPFPVTPPTDLDAGANI
ncbi:MAG: hypothetical protein ACKV0T_27590 [Planctomycetales bacterium]